MSATCVRLVAPFVSIAVVARPVVPSPLRSWWKLVSSDCNVALPPVIGASMVELYAPLLSVAQTRYRSLPVAFQATS